MRAYRTKQFVRSLRLHASISASERPVEPGHQRVACLRFRPCAPAPDAQAGRRIAIAADVVAQHLRLVEPLGDLPWRKAAPIVVDARSRPGRRPSGRPRCSTALRRSSAKVVDPVVCGAAQSADAACALASARAISAFQPADGPRPVERVAGSLRPPASTAC